MPTVKRVLFVDVRNTARSPIAEAWFNQLALGWGRAASCGTMPASHFDMLAVQVMAEVGAPIRPHLPRAVNQQLLSRADFVVIMGRDVPARAFGNAVVWNFPDPTGQELTVYRQLRDDILDQVRVLIQALHPVEPDALEQIA
jgi:arsenate reductase (thioredoxin)